MFIQVYNEAPGGSTGRGHLLSQLISCCSCCSRSQQHCIWSSHWQFINCSVVPDEYPPAMWTNAVVLVDNHARTCNQAKDKHTVRLACGHVVISLMKTMICIIPQSAPNEMYSGHDVVNSSTLKTHSTHVIRLVHSLCTRSSVSSRV